MRGVLLSATALLLVGCVGTNVPIAQATYPTSDRLLATQYLHADANTEKITVIRSAHTFVGAGLPFRVSVDSAKVAVIDPGEKVDLYLTNGEHVLTIGPDKLRAITVPDVSTVINIPTRITIYRANIDAAGIRINPSAE